MRQSCGFEGSCFFVFFHLRSRALVFLKCTDSLSSLFSPWRGVESFYPWKECKSNLPQTAPRSLSRRPPAFTQDKRKQNQTHQTYTLIHSKQRKRERERERKTENERKKRIDLHSSRIRDFEEVKSGGLQLHVRSLGQADVCYPHEISFLQTQILHELKKKNHKHKPTARNQGGTACNSSNSLPVQRKKIHKDNA